MSLLIQNLKDFTHKLLGLIEDSDKSYKSTQKLHFCFHLSATVRNHSLKDTICNNNKKNIRDTGTCLIKTVQDTSGENY